MKEKKTSAKRIGPTMTAEMVAQELEETPNWVRKLARRDPETHAQYLPGYVRKDASSKPRAGRDEWLAEDFISSRNEHAPHVPGVGGRLYFYAEDVEAYKEKFPIPDENGDEPVKEEDPILIARVKEIALPELNERGYVTRTRVKSELVRLYPQDYSDRVQARVSAICAAQGWPMPNNVHPKRTKK